MSERSYATPPLCNTYPHLSQITLITQFLHMYIHKDGKLPHIWSPQFVWLCSVPLQSPLEQPDFFSRNSDHLLIGFDRCHLKKYYAVNCLLQIVRQVCFQCNTKTTNKVAKQEIFVTPPRLAGQCVCAGFWWGLILSCWRKKAVVCSNYLLSESEIEGETDDRIEVNVFGKKQVRLSGWHPQFHKPTVPQFPGPQPKPPVHKLQ